MLVLQERSFFVWLGTYYKAADCLVKTRAGQMILLKKGYTTSGPKTGFFQAIVLIILLKGVHKTGSTT